MMKKKMVTVLAAALFTLGAAANAMAYWSAGDLIQVVYNHAGTYEVATDLGAVSSFSGTAAVTASTLSQLGVSDYNQLYVTYFATNKSNTAWVNGATGTAPVTNNRQYSTLNTNFTNLMNYYSSLDTGATGQAVGSQSYTNSYNTLMAKNGAAYGVLGTYLNGVAGSLAETSLAALTSGSTAGSTLYVMNGQGSLSGPTTGQVALNITTTPTPIPPSFLLMGSGLLGMVGIRRKFNA